MNGAELLVETLGSHGISTVFGFPGDTSIAFYDAMRCRADAVRHVLVRDERHAGFMADAYARTTQRLGVCEAASGAGAVYLASGLAEALTSRIPVLPITTDNSTRSAGTAPISEMNQEALLGACTIWCHTVTEPSEIPAAVAQAVRRALGGPGPVSLILPEDILEQNVSVPAAASAISPAADQIDRPAASPDAVRVAAEAIAGASRPVLVSGGDLHLAGAWAQLRTLVEHAALPVATSIHGKGALDEAHPLALGVVGNNGARDYANEWVASSDCVLFVGTRANATDTLSFTAPPRSSDVRVIQIDIDPARAGQNYPSSTPLVGDAGTVLAQLAAATPPAAEKALVDRVRELASSRANWWAGVDLEPTTLAADTLHPAAVVRTLYEVFGRDTWVTADAGTPTPYLSAFWEAPGDSWRVVIPRGHGPMGFALPASIGIAIGHPGERVLCLTTENSVAMSVAEWETAKRLDLPITYIVMDNTSMSWIKMIQHLYAGSRYFAVDPGPINPVLLGAGMGLPGTRARSMNELAAVAKHAADMAGPMVIHVVVPEHMQLPPPVASWKAALSGQQTTRPIH